MATKGTRWKQLGSRVSATADSGRAWWLSLAYPDDIAKLLDKEDFATAEARLQADIAAADRSTGNASKRIELRIQLALVRRHQADTDSLQLANAESLLREAIAVAAQVKNVPAYVECLDRLSEIFEMRDEWAAVEASLRDAVRIQASLPAAELPATWLRHQRLAVARYHLNDFEGACQASIEALRLAEKVYGPDHLEVGNLLTEAGRMLRAQGNFTEAEVHFRRAIGIHRKLLGDGAPQVLTDLEQLASSIAEAGDQPRAAKEYELCLTVKQRQLGLQHIDELGLMQYSLANIYISWGELARARELLIDAIGAFRPQGGARLAVAHETLAQVEEASGRYPLALLELELAAKSWERCGTERTAELVRNLEYRADLLVEMRKHREAGWLRERAEERRAIIAALADSGSAVGASNG